MALDHRKNTQRHLGPEYQFPIHTVIQHGNTPRSTPPLQPQLYIKTEHRPSVHRSDSYQQMLQRERTATWPLNTSLASQTLLVEDDEHEDNDHDFEDDENLDLSDDDEVDLEKEEDVDDYCYGGYHPVEIGERFGTNKQYKIVRKLGWGHFSTVWLAFDQLSDRHVAIKIVRSKTNYSQAAMDEIKILERASSADPSHPGYKHLVKMYEWFYHDGPHGRHVCMVFEVLGQTTLGLIEDCKKSLKDSTKKNSSAHKDVIDLLTLEKSYGGLPLSITKKITKQLLLALDYMHRSCGLIHTDIKPENILIEIRDVEKFVRCLKSASLNNRKQRHSSSSTSSSDGSRSRSARSTRNKSVCRCDTPVRCSKPLPSPLSASTKLDFKDYFSSNYSLGSPSPMNINSSPEARHSRLQGSINYYDDGPDPREPTSASNSPTSHPTTSTAGSSHLTSLVISASEANSDDEDEDEDDESALTRGIQTPEMTAKQLHSRLSSVSLEDPDEISELINIKLADLGNACYYNMHYTDDIQTRQYRSPEILLGHRWGVSTDIWSAACVIFELLTGDYLFDPKNGKHHTKDDDHIAQIIELMELHSFEERDKFVKFVKESKYSNAYFHSDGYRLRKIETLKFWPLDQVLMQKYKMEPETAREMAEFLIPMLAYDPKKRVDAGGWSNHKWLDDVKSCEHIERHVGTRGEDIKGWYKLYERRRL